MGGRKIFTQAAQTFDLSDSKGAKEAGEGFPLPASFDLNVLNGLNDLNRFV
jgi:hypothetical protein